jgi:Uma2 family endonuclease
MATIAAPPVMPRRTLTLDEYLALPEDEAVERMLIDGELWEYPVPESNRHHGRALIRTGKFLDNWLDTQPEPRGAVVGGDAGVVFNDRVSFGVDVAYVSAAVMAVQSDDASTRIVGVPVLAVEISSPGEVKKRRDAKLAAYRKAGVPLVWLLDPELKTITAIRPDGSTATFSGQQEVTAEDVLPGFRVPAADLFG